jgi:hypothetical protein
MINLIKETAADSYIKKIISQVSFITPVESILWTEEEIEDIFYMSDCISDFIDNLIDSIPPIISCYTAISYLREKDHSLMESLELAINEGKEITSIDANVLADLLYKKNIEEELLDLLEVLMYEFDNIKSTQQY